MSGSCAEIVRSMLRLHSDSWLESDENYSHILVDFVRAIPTESERQLYETAQQIIVRGNEVVDDLLLYGEGPKEAAVKALRDGSESEKVACAMEMEPYVDRIKASFGVAKMIQQVLPKLLWELCSGPLPPVEQLECRQALLRQFASLIVMAQRFDEMKMQTPSMINHYSIYRRVASTIDSLNFTQDIQLDSEITWFLASANSMSDVLYKATESFCEKEEVPKENTIDTLYTIIRVCCSMLVPSPSPSSSPQLPPDTRLFVQRVLVGCVLLFDSVHPQGSFHRDSIIDMRTVISVLTQDPSNKPHLLHPLIEQLNHTRKTPVSPKVRALFNAA